ncbi:hypothetical protein O9993_18595 [Vibrio lentus]|nr:hypothetical protein [Vibrio lentus]
MIVELHIFDRNFIHRNVMSGTVNNRENSRGTFPASFLGGKKILRTTFEALKAKKKL